MIPMRSITLLEISIEKELAVCVHVKHGDIVE